MNPLIHPQRYLVVGLLGLAAATVAVSVAAVSYQPSRSMVGFLGVMPLVLGLFSLFVWARPLVTLALALGFLTSPIPLMLTLPQSAAVSMILLGGATAGFILRTPWRAIEPNPLFLPLGIFAAYGMISAVHGLFLGNQISYLLGDCFQLIEFALFFFLVSQLLRNGGDFRFLLRTALISILITVFVELVLFALGPQSGGLLPSGIQSADELVRTIDIDATVLFAVLINLYPLARSPRQRYLIWAALIPTVADILLSLSRGLWICSLVAVVFSLALQDGRTRARLLKTSVGLGIFIVLLATVWRIAPRSDLSIMDIFEERIYHGVDQVEFGLEGVENMGTRRFLEMAIVGPQVLSRPLFGYGLGATYVIGGFAILDSDTKGVVDHHFIHNFYLVTAFRMGLVGLALLFWVFFRYFRRTISGYRTMSAGFEKALVAGLVAGVMGQLVLSITQPTIMDHPTCALIACAMAISLKLSQPASILQKARAV